MTVTATAVVSNPKARAESVNDQPSDVDRIGFKPYVDALAQFLLAGGTKPPITVSLEGEWGTGKSSFMVQLEKALRSIDEAQRLKLVEHVERHDSRVRSEEQYQDKQSVENGIKKLKNEAQAPAGTPSAPPPKVSKRIAADSGIHIIRFNAWRHDKEEALWASFALEFARKVTPHNWGRAAQLRLRLAWAQADSKDIAVALARLGLLAIAALILAVAVIHPLFFPTLASDQTSYFQGWADYVKRWWPPIVASPVVAILIAVLQRLRFNPMELEVIKGAKGADYKSKVSFLERFQEDFEQFLKIYVGNRRTFVLIDDLDRCEVPKAAELLQAVNLMLPTSMPVFLILALDRQKVAMGIAARNERLLPFMAVDDKDRAKSGLKFGNEFIEKFIQVQFRIPHLDKGGLDRYLDSLLNAAAPTSTASPSPTLIADPVASDPTIARQIMRMAAPIVGSNPRRLKQFLNLWRLRLYIAAQTKQLSTDSDFGWTLPQLGKIVLLEIHWAKLLDQAIADPELLLNIRDEPTDKTAPWGFDPTLRALLNFTPGGKEDDQAFLLNSNVLLSLPRLYGSGGDDQRRSSSRG